MKKFYRIIATTLILTLFVGCSKKTAQTELYTYTKSEDHVVIDTYKGKETDVVIPSKIDNLPVTGISDHAFDGVYSIKSITIPDSVTDVGSFAFANCLSLEKATVGKGVTELSEGMFAYSTALAALDLQGKITSVSNLALANTKIISDESKEFVTIGDGILVAYHSKGPDVVIPDNIKNIGTIFIGNPDIHSIYIPDVITSIANSAFASCENLSQVTLPSTLTYIGTLAFSGCKSLESIDIPAGVNELSDMVFLNCQNLKSVTLPDSIQTMGENIFVGCSKELTLSAPFDSVAFQYAAANNLKVE